MRRASTNDVHRLVSLMAEFYAESGYSLNHRRAADAFTALLSDERLGSVWLIQSEAKDVGYLVVTLGYSMEYGGLDAILDDLFIQPAYRGLGLATDAMKQMREFCIELGVRAMHLEVARDNAPAQAAYRRVGFASTDRQLLTLRLAEPTHEE
jgi:GNAT superfamily N-acetyltransferase